MGPKTLCVLEETALPAPLVAAAFSRALQRARDYEGATAPNPPVGCVVLDAGGKQLAIAAHQKAGGLHAEALAIEQCRQQGTFAAIHTLLVTLEPCNHSGRTPPCSDTILTTPARRVWIGCKDPNRAVVGGGSEKLVAHGLSVRFIAGLDDERAAELTRLSKRLLAPFARLTSTGRPWLTIKQAINRAGSMVPEPGHKTFTSKTSLLFAHKLRKRADAILTGSGTILADNPLFTVRQIADFEDKRRHLVIMDRRGRVPETYLEAARRAGFMPRLETDLDAALARLGRAGVLKVLLEAGPALLEAVLAGGFWDEHVTITQSPISGRDDHISLRYRGEINPAIAGKEEHVFRDY